MWVMVAVHLSICMLTARELFLGVNSYFDPMYKEKLVLSLDIDYFFVLALNKVNLVVQKSRFPRW